MQACTCGHAAQKHSPVRQYHAPYGPLDHADVPAHNCAECTCKRYAPECTCGSHPRKVDPACPLTAYVDRMAATA